MREVHGVDIPRKPPKRASILGTRKTARSWRYLAWIRSLPCAVCGAHAEAAHTGSDGGMSIKSSDWSCVPLCTSHHQEYHQIGRGGVENKYGIYFADIVRKLNHFWFDFSRAVK
jgi:hypothetical protein